MILFASCDPDIDGCTVWASHNYNPEANFDDGSCNLWRDKFIGPYNAFENCSGFYEYQFGIGEGIVDFDHIILNNFGDFGVNLSARVQGDAIFIDNQSFGLSNGAFLEIWNAIGKFEAGDVIINYEYALDGLPDICSIQAKPI